MYSILQDLAKFYMWPPINFHLCIYIYSPISLASTSFVHYYLTLVSRFIYTEKLAVLDLYMQMGFLGDNLLSKKLVMVCTQLDVTSFAILAKYVQLIQFIYI